MKWLSNAWKWFDGRKTAIGAAMLMAAQYVDEPTVKVILEITGQILTAGGLVHKVSKSELPSGLTAKVNQLKSLVKK